MVFRHFFRAYWTGKQAANLQCIMIKIPHAGVSKSGDIHAADVIQTMKQNVEVMNQIYKNFSSMIEDDWQHRRFGNDYLVLELLVENELIKWVLAVPSEHLEAIEQSIGGFYPGAVIDRIDQPALLDVGKHCAGGTFHYDRESAYPLKTYEVFEADPMESILSACSRLSVDEKLSIQRYVAPVNEKTVENITDRIDELLDETKKGWFFSRLVQFLVKGDDDKKDEKKIITGQKQGDMEKKKEDELFKVSIRALAIAPAKARADHIIKDLGKTFSQYGYQGLNSIKTGKVSDSSLEEFVKSFVRKDMTPSDVHFWESRKYDVMSTKELSSLFHFPHWRFNRNPRIKWQKFKIVPAPEIIPHDGLFLGTNSYGGIKKDIYVKPVDRFRHFYIIGQTGTGKSTMMENMIINDMLNGDGCCVIDPHGQLCEHVLPYLPKERINDLIYFDLANTEYPIAFNIFEAESDDERDVVTNDIIEMFVGMYGPEIFGPRIQDYFRNASFLLMEQPDGGTLIEIMRLFTDPPYLETKLKNLTNPVIASRWNKTYRAMGDREKAEIIPFLQAKFGPFTSGTYVRNVIGQPKSAFNIGQAMQDRKIILCNLSKGLTGEDNSQLIGRMFSIQVKIHALRRAAIPEDTRVPFYLYVDEFQNYVSKSFESILSEARKYRLGLCVAHQYIEQLKAG